MRENDAGATTGERPTRPRVAPRFTRAAQAERSRLEDKREQLLRKREAAQAEVGRMDQAVGAVDELLELLAPLLAANGGEPETAEEGREGRGAGAGSADQLPRAKEDQP